MHLLWSLFFCEVERLILDVLFCVMTEFSDWNRSAVGLIGIIEKR